MLTSGNSMLTAVRGSRYFIAADKCNSSVPFPYNTAATLFAPLASNSLQFYQAQRDGPDVISSVMLREPSHLDDMRALQYQDPLMAKSGSTSVA